ncbi:hypothetical protein HGO26_11095 [Shewanella sp. S-1]|uniref:DUF6575 domain-containing protein n=1 Tax=Shewanella oncorhynchi TaxID=2726434 RepID=A0ABX1KQ17_9GAMM|nr:DUF6575 domain-containing protein [Shewanella oncorhynchi]NLQ23418.1 hypothetical protein [Shewanella oncorhynchi]
MKKSELLFIKSEAFGSLYYHNVYSFYEQPLTFVALNDYGQLFFCYSLGLDDEYIKDQWIIVPISEENVNKLEQKDIPIIKAIKQSSTSHVLILDILLESGELIEKKALAKNLDFFFPDENVFIHENVNYDGTRKHTHRIRFSKKAQSPIASDVLDSASKAFNEFCKNFLKYFDVKTNFYHHDAIVGSFVYRVKASQIEELQSKGHAILSRISNIDEFIYAIENKEIDLRLARNLFDELLNSELKVELYDEESTELILSLEHEYVQSLLKEVDKRIGVYLDSTMVPQADNLDRIKLYLGLVAENQIVTSDNLKVDPRQVSYYRDACQLLSLTHSYGKITPIGYKALMADNEEDFLKIIQRQFEEMECGHIWMTEQNVTSMLEINENTAAQFLIKNCNGLSDNTSKRRAQTLSSWVRKFKKYAI